MTNDEIEKAREMSIAGKNLPQIGKELGVDKYELWKEAKSWNHAKSWQGAKWVITNRLNRLVKAKDPAVRERLVKEAKDCSDYIYYGGKGLRLRIDHASAALEDKK